MTNEEYKDLFDSATVGLWRTTIDEGNFLNVNSAVANILGYDDIDDLMKYRAVDLYNPGDRDSLIAELKAVQEIEDFETCMKKKDGSSVWVSISAKIHPDKGYIEGSIRDISDQKIEEEKVIPHLQKLSCLKQSIIKKLQEEVNVVSKHKPVKIA